MMEEKKTAVEEILKKMREGSGEEPTAMVLMSKLLPEMVPKQAEDRKFVMELPHIPPKYKHLIMIGVAVAAGSPHCAKTHIRIANRAGATKEEIAEAIITARFALGSTCFSTAIEGMEYLASE